MATFIDETEAFVMLPAKLEKLNLTTDAYRTLSHLKYRLNNATKQCNPSYKTIGESCFRGSYPNSPVETLEKKAKDSIKELIGYGIIQKKRRRTPNGKDLSNQYILKDSRFWKESKVPSPLAHKAQPGRGKRRNEGVRDITPTENEGVQGVTPLGGTGDNPRGGTGDNPQGVRGIPQTRSIKELDQTIELKEKEEKIYIKKEEKAQKQEKREETSKDPINTQAANSSESDFVKGQTPPQPEVILSMDKNDKAGMAMSKIERYGAIQDRGGKIPREELLELAKEELGGYVEKYRKGGRILNSSANDLNRDFVAYVADSLKKEDKRKDQSGTDYTQWALNQIRKYETLVAHWENIRNYVDGWQSGKTSEAYGEKQGLFEKFRTWSKSQHEMRARDYKKDSGKFLASASWHKYWVEYVNEHFPELIKEIKEQENSDRASTPSQDVIDQKLKDLGMM